MHKSNGSIRLKQKVFPVFIIKDGMRTGEIITVFPIEPKNK